MVAITNLRQLNILKVNGDFEKARLRVKIFNYIEKTFKSDSTEPEPSMKSLSNKMKFIAKDLPAFIIYHTWLRYRSKYSKKIAILMYHSLKDGVKHRLAVEPNEFEKQMQWLIDDGWKIVSLGRIVNEFETIGDKSVVISLDDGYEDNYTNGLEIFKRLNIRPAIFLTEEYIGTERMFPWFDKNAKWAKSLSWNQIQEMKEYGIEFGSHTCSHPILTTLNDPADLDREIRDSKKRLEKKLNKVDYFCYPSGDTNREISKLVRVAGYVAALSIWPGLVINEQVDWFMLPRIEVSGFDSLNTFKMKVEGAYVPAHKIIQLIRKLKKISNG